MFAINHAVTGAIIAVTVKRPELAVPLAFASHFVLDALPHYGGVAHTTRKFVNILGIDALLILTLLAFLVIDQPAHWQLAIACAVAASSPDVMWLPYWLREISGKRHQDDPLDPVSKAHRSIQWGERPWGMNVEAVWLVVTAGILAKLTI